MSPPGDRRDPPADTKCPPAAQRKQASALVSIIIYVFLRINRISWLGGSEELFFFLGFIDFL